MILGLMFFGSIFCTLLMSKERHPLTKYVIVVLGIPLWFSVCGKFAQYYEDPMIFVRWGVWFLAYYVIMFWMMVKIEKIDVEDQTTKYEEIMDIEIQTWKLDNNFKNFNAKTHEEYLEYVHKTHFSKFSVKAFGIFWPLICIVMAVNVIGAWFSKFTSKKVYSKINSIKGK